MRLVSSTDPGLRATIMRPARSTDLGPRAIIAAGRGWSRSSISTTTATATAMAMSTAMVGITTDIGFDTPNTPNGDKPDGGG